MRILVVSNLYPPLHFGGYELGCQEVVEELQRRGHNVFVLTSRYGHKRAVVDGNVLRWLGIELEPRYASRSFDPVPFLLKELRNRRMFNRCLAEVRPQAIYYWNLGHMSVSLLRLGAHPDRPSFVFVSDHWLAGLEKAEGWARWWSSTSTGAARRTLKLSIRSALKAFGLSPFPPAVDELQFASRHLLEEAAKVGKFGGRSKVVHWGVDALRFPLRRSPPANPLRLLIAGQVAPHKGIHTALRAFARLHEARAAEGIALDIVGGSVDPAYCRQLALESSVLGVSEAVRFLPAVPRASIPRVLGDHDVFLFPSEWEEPFSIGLLEAMASGMGIVATSTGGTPEALSHGINALLFPAGDFSVCAQQLRRFLDDPGLVTALGAEARRTVERKFRFDRMVDSIEESLLAVKGGATVRRER
jgi:glycosyltransferase involved in cell wall biosynthesis